MLMNDTESHVEYIDDAIWQRLVGALLDADGAEIINQHSQEIFVGIGAGTRLYRVTGTAVDAGRPVPWSVVVKMLTLDQLNFQSISTDESSWDYWKREWHAYRSAWLHELPGPLVAPRCLATGEVLTETDEELAWIAMEDLGAADPGPFPPGHFREVARHVGVFNGGYLDGRGMPDDPWLGHHWLRGWTAQIEPVLEMLPTVANHPIAGRIFTVDLVGDLIAVWDQREKLYAALDQLPQTLCHNDVFHRNLFVRGAGRPNQSVVIDWAFCGPGPIGQELSPLVGATLAFGGSWPDHWANLERECLEGYADGLRQTGFNGPDEILLGYLLSSILRFGVGAVASVLGLTLTNEHEEILSRVFGYSYEEFIAHAATVFRFQQSRIHRARALLGI
jgi:Phosphotransferase enzyme family